MTFDDRLARTHGCEVEALTTARAARRARIVAELGLEALAAALARLHTSRYRARAFAGLATARLWASRTGDEQPSACTTGVCGIARERKATGV